MVALRRNMEKHDERRIMIGKLNFKHRVGTLWKLRSPPSGFREA